MFYPKVIIRTPSLAFSDYISEDFLKSFLDNKQFAEAVYLASPVLFQQAILWRNNKISDINNKIAISLGKYYGRMSSRCTPFGLFASCGVVDWSSENNLQLSQSTQRHTRLDMHYTGALAQYLSEIPSIKMSLTYFPNSSFYQIGEEIRYIEYKYVDGRRFHQISAILWTEFIQKILDLSKVGTTIKYLIDNMVDEGISEEESIAFIQELIDIQLLVNELEPSITGSNFTHQIQKVLSSKEELAIRLKKVESLLLEMDQRGINDIGCYQEIIELLKSSFEVPFEEGKLFQTDLIRLFTQKSLNKNYQEVLREILYLSKNINNNAESLSLTTFKKQYLERYETKELPILFILDTETGLGYGDRGKNNNTSISEGLIFPIEADEKIDSRTPFQQYLFKCFLKANKNNAYQVDLQPEELNAYSTDNQRTSPSSSITFRLTGNDKFPIYLEGISGSSAVNLLGRFAHADKNILDIVCDIAAQEQAKNPDIIFAEIVHLPENRTGNILLHPPFRAYEIPYLAKSSLPKENQIHLDDLMVSVDLKQNRVILRSKRLNKEIIPRLSNAHNYSHNSLPLYHFLCDIQNQNTKQDLNWGWKKITKNSVFSPRLTYRNVVLELASWSFQKEDFRSFIHVESDVLMEKVNNFRIKWNIPQYFVLADLDNELMINSQNLLSLKIWIDTIKNREIIELKEFLYDFKNSPVKNLEGKGFTNQFIASWINEIDTIPSMLKIFENKTQRNFSLGSEWIYFKFYTGSKGCDLILTNVIKPVVSELLENNLIDNWFFVRYADPEKHLRFRLHLSKIANFGKVIEIINKATLGLENDGIIWKIQTDTYQREMERYGENVIELTEKLFCEDSMAIITMLNQVWGDERESVRWQWCLKMIDVYLNDFGYSLTQKRNLLEQLKTYFSKEFKVEKTLKMQLDKRFRDNRRTIEHILNSNFNDIHTPFSVYFQSISIKSVNTKYIIQQIKEIKHESDWNQYISDIIHMTVNRCISDNQRLHELVMYDFLFRYYHSELAKLRMK